MIYIKTLNIGGNLILRGAKFPIGGYPRMVRATRLKLQIIIITFSKSLFHFYKYKLQEKLYKTVLILVLLSCTVLSQRLSLRTHRFPLL